jgi:hypothetical protein
MWILALVLDEFSWRLAGVGRNPRKKPTRTAAIGDPTAEFLSNLSNKADNQGPTLEMKPIIGCLQQSSQKCVTGKIRVGWGWYGGNLNHIEK